MDETEDDDPTCWNCDGEMEWCATCYMWTRTCCEDWGTCMCS